MEKNQQQSGVSASVIAANWVTFERKIDEIHDIQANISSILQRSQGKRHFCLHILKLQSLYSAVYAYRRLHERRSYRDKPYKRRCHLRRLKTTLGDDYVQARDVGHNCLSEDGIIDASTCMLPENTWFIKNYGHAMFDYRRNGCDLYVRAMTAKTQPTVDTWGGVSAVSRL